MREVDWRDHFLKQRKSGLSISQYCREHNLTPSAFYHARKRLKEPAAFTPVIVREKKKARTFELSISVTQDKLYAFSGTTDNPKLLELLLTRGAS